jgi:Tfp pilus assembly protein PilN
MQYKMVDPNSAQYRQDVERLQSLRTLVVLWLIVLALGVVFIPLMLISGWVRNDVARLETEILGVRSAISSTTTLSSDVIKLQTDIAAVNQLATTIQSATVPSGVNWPLVMGAISQYDPAAIEITSLTESTDKIQLAGLAANNDAVVRYQQSLLDSGVFKDVVVLSMSALPPPPPTPVPVEGEEAPEPVDLPFGTVEFLIDVVVGTPAP